VRRQLLETEDREKAQRLKNAAKPDSEVVKVSTEDLEKDLQIAEQEREGQAAG
jgi:hypothetical protein